MSVVVYAVAAIVMAIGLVLLSHALPSEPEPESFRGTMPRPADSGSARSARLGLGLVLAVVAAWAAFALSPLSCSTGAGLAGPYWIGELIAQPQLVLVPALVFGAGGWVALGDPEAGWRVTGLGLAAVAALAVLLIALALTPACA